jgi:hypothetical protein
LNLIALKFFTGNSIRAEYTGLSMERGRLHPEALMSVRFHPSSAIYDGSTDTVRVPVVDDNKLVIVAIAREAIMRSLWSGDGPPDCLIEVYHRHKRALHALALHKYMSRQVESDGSVLIEPGDLTRPGWTSAPHRFAVN